MESRWLGNWRGDLAGGITAAVLTIPVSMGYGILALSPLGDAYVSYGALAGLYSAIFVPIAAVLLGANTPMIYAPRSVVTFLLGSIVFHSLVGTHVAHPADVRQTLALLLLVVLMAGLCQALFGAFRLGAFVQFIPSPVMAGFQNAAAFLIFLSQLDSLVGFRHHVPPLQFFGHLGEIQPLTLAVGAATALAMGQAPRVTRKVPPAIAGLLVGSAVYYVARAVTGGAGLGPIVGAMPDVRPSLGYVRDMTELASTPAFWSALPGLATGALSLAIVASLDGLLCAKTVAAVTGTKVHGNRELLRLGVGNAVAACFGGIAGGVNLASSFANHRAGGRTGASILASALAILLAVLLVAPLIAYIPRAVIAGLLAMVAIQLFDRWAFQLVGRVASGKVADRRSTAADVLVVLLVAVVAIATNLVAAVALGIGLTILSFLFRMSRSVVRRAYGADAVRSRRTRAPGHAELLRGHGRRILVLELEGPIFFGTAESLAARIEQALGEGVTHVVLDLKRVNDIDTTGARILLEIHQRVARAGAELAVSHAEWNRRIAHVLRDMGVMAALTRDRSFVDTDRALEWAENGIIAGDAGGPAAADEYPLDRLEILAGLTADECLVLGERLERRIYGKGDIVFREGDAGRELFMIARGAASATIRLGEGRENRLASFSAGTVFGELALLDRAPRSATIAAEDELVCYVLTDKAFDELTRDHARIAVVLLANLARELSGRLRQANRTIYELES